MALVRFGWMHWPCLLMSYLSYLCLQIAWANDIKVREDADLVEILSAIDVDSEIPIEAFAAVAEILAYVYRVNAGQIPIDELDENQENNQ